jgi:uncharacterized membrane protein YfcA
MDAHSLFLVTAIAVTSFALSFYGAAVGLVLGHLRLPLLIYYLPSTAAGMATNLVISGLGALTGAVRHARSGNVSLHLLALMGIPSVLGALLGGIFLARIDAAWARVAIGIFLVTSGVNLIYIRTSAGTVANPIRCLRVLWEIVIGLAIGFLAAVTGLMLGSVRLPMMIRLLKIDPRVAVGTNMAIGCLTAFAGSLALWPRGVRLPLLTLLIVTPPTIVGGYLGARFTTRIRREVLQGLVGGTVALTGVGMAAEGVWKTLLS